MKHMKTYAKYDLTLSVIDPNFVSGFLILDFHIYEAPCTANQSE